MKKFSVPVAAFLTLLAVTACTKTDTSDTGTSAAVSGARSAVEFVVSLGSMSNPVVTRPPALLGVYVNTLLADGVAVPVLAARAGIDVQVVLHAPASERNLDDTYELLEEFASILHVDIADLLNRSPDRALTLDEYLTGLTNITERSHNRAEDLSQQMKEMKVEERDRRKEQTTIEREVSNAVKLKDFGTAGAKQRELIDAQERVSRVTLQLKEVTSLQKTFSDLLDVADVRITAITSNREILIAGLRAVDVPGVEDLNVIEGASKKRRSGGTGTFGNF